MAEGTRPAGDLPPAADPWAAAPTPGARGAFRVTGPAAAGATPPAGGAWNPPVPALPAYHPGRAVIGAATVQPPMQTTSEYPPELREHAERVLGPARPPRSVRRQQLRRGGGWSWFGGIFAFVCWGVWAISVRGGSIAVPALGLLTMVAVAAGVFGLARLLGAVVLERGLGRARSSAWGAHLAAGAFCVATGVAYLGQTTWFVEVLRFLRGLG
ncbi:hypothetical protein GCM10010124_33800 [Pilimelia terevasa]|uniref:Uncharacterized protein n=1 Tax=Pilimelia terevasa TaxID=53372 RepID=A0A8J3BSZ8_9ACTN|nr:hypothetical protein [Pilimelia terevasa]GGK38211.1 hypothetical protein GCM10010124_33800 [Pilimelia terevasa]